MVNRNQFLRQLGLLGAATLTGCASAPKSRKGPEFRVLTYNIHHGEGTDGRLDPERLAQVIHESKADLVALQEVDRGVARTQGRDLPAELAQLTGLTALFANNYSVQGGEYGNAILTRFPVQRWTHLRFQPVRPGETRGLIQAVVDVEGTEVAFLNTHLDHRPGDVDRLASAEEILTAAAVFGKMPLVLCGDFNDLPGSRLDVRLSESFRDAWRKVGVGDGSTSPTGDLKRRIDYVWLRGPVEATAAEVIPGTASDHAALRVSLRLTSGVR